MDINELRNALEDNRRNSKLQLGYALFDMSEAGVIEVSKFVEENPFVLILDLRGNNIGATAALRLSKALKINKSIQGLILKGNVIGKDPAGVQALCSAMKVNMSIVHLDLTQCEINAEGAKYIAELLLENTTLLHLDMTNNPIGADGTAAILDATKKNKSLLVCDLKGCKSGEEIMHEITFNMRENKKKVLKSKAPVDLQAALDSADQAAIVHVEEQKVKKAIRLKAGDIWPATPRRWGGGRFNAMRGHALMLKLMMKEREETLPDEKALYRDLVIYMDTMFNGVVHHHECRGEAEHREWIATKGFEEREKRYIREVKETEVKLQKALAEKESLKRILNYNEMILKDNNEAVAEALCSNELFQQQAVVDQQGWKQQVAALAKDRVDLLGKLALNEQDSELLEEEVQDMRAHVAKFQGDMRSFIEP